MYIFVVLSMGLFMGVCVCVCVCVCVFLSVLGGALLVQPLSVGDLLSILFCVRGFDLVVLFFIVCCGASCSLPCLVLL